MRPIETHTTDYAEDVNRRYSLAAVDPLDSSCSADYVVSSAGGPAVLELNFHTPHRDGLTNEILLAVVKDRLERFQQGPNGCPENSAAAHHLTHALRILKERTARLHGVTKMAEAKNRVRVEGLELHVGDQRFETLELLKWSAWDGVTAACKKLDPPLSHLELGVIESLAAASGKGGANGFAEMKQALAQSRKA